MKNPFRLRNGKVWMGCLLIAALLFSGTGVEEQGTGVRAETLYTKDRIQLKAMAQAATSGATQPSAYESTTTFMSPVLTADFAFDAIGMEWEQSVPQGTSSEFYLRVKPLKKGAGEWTGWIDVDPDIDFKEGTKPEDLKEVSKIVPTTRAREFQYKVVLESPEGTATPRLQKIRFHYIDGSARAPTEGRSSLLPVPLSLLNKLTFGDSNISVISRSQWAADESWRTRKYFGLEETEPSATDSEDSIAQELEELEQVAEQAGKNGEEKSLRELYPEEFELTQTIDKNEQSEALLWPMEYAKNIEKIVVHHTASTGNLDNPEAALRAIYYYHAVRRGWGDIGYNYLIDPQGNIYEGRAGGERVVAGHAQGYNTGSIGIAVIGNYQENQVPYEVFEALSALIQEKADLYNIKIDGVSTFRGELFPNVMGHRDVASTACPGQKLYDALPTLIRLMARQSTDLEGRLASQTTNKPYEFASISDYLTLRLNPEASTQLKIQIKNIGTETWNSETYLVADQNPSADRLLHWVRDAKNPDSIGSMVLENGKSEVKPGETATFVLNAEATLRGGFENFNLTPIFNGVKKTTHYLDLPIYVDAPVLSYEKIELIANATRVKPGQNVSGTVKLRNTGNVNWYATGTYSMRLGGTTAKPFATLKESVVKPGGVGTFDFAFTARREAGRYRAALNPVIENADPVKGPALEVEVIVYDTTAKGELVAMSGGGGEELKLSPGEQRSLWIELKNTGDQSWEKLGKKRFTVGITRNPSIKLTKPILEKATVQPDETVRLRFTLTAPMKAGRYKVYLRPRLGSQNLMKKPITLNFSVKSGTTANLATATALDQETIRIKLGFNPIKSGNPIIKGSGSYDLVLDGKPFLALDASDSVEVRWMTDRYQILHDGQAWVVEQAPRFVPAEGPASTIFRIDNWSRPPAWNPNLNDNTFRGILEVREADGQLTVINELPMEHYLRGIAEVENAAPREKIRTLMIIARTYARYYLTEEEKFPGKPYHLSDNPDESQKYLGYGFEKRAPAITKAVNDTAGKIVTYNGKIVKTPYFSASDGTATKSAQQVWGWTHTPYLVSVPDPLCTTSKTFQGHGVGLSGCGATAAAERGYTYEEIIKYYYTGVEIIVH